MKRLFCALTAAYFIFCGSCAYLVAGIQEAPELLLEQDLVVTATKFKQKLSEAPAIMSVITADEIEQMSARDVMDVLKRIPGLNIYIARYGQRRVVVRGIELTDGSEKVKVLLDGHSINEPFFGSAMTLHDDLVVENIKRIEVIRGPGSALYGANAFVAVINIITKDAADVDGIKTGINTGRFKTRAGSVLYGKTHNDLEVSGYAQYYKTDGPRLLLEQDLAGKLKGFGLPFETLTPGDTNLWKEKTDLNLKIKHSSGLTFNSKYTHRRRADYIGLVWSLGKDSDMNLQQMFAELGYVHSLLDNKLSMEYKLAADLFTEDVLFDVFPQGTFGLPESYKYGTITKDSIYELSAKGDYTLSPANVITVGGTYEKITQFDVAFKTNANPFTNAYLGGYMDVTNRWNWNIDTTREIGALYAQDVWDINEKVGLTLGARYDHYNDFGGTTNPRAGLVWNVYKDMYLKILYGEAFRAPNFRELYDRNNTNTVGNPELKPEKIKTSEIGFDYPVTSKVKTRANYFKNEIKDLITNDFSQLPSPFINRGTAKVQGVECEIKAFLNTRSYVYGNYSYQDARDKKTDKFLGGVPFNKGNLGVNYAVANHINVNMNFYLSGQTPRAASDTRPVIPGYVTIDTAILSQDVWKNVDISLSVYNLLDKKYFDPDLSTNVLKDYPQAGRNMFVKARYKF
ncbi:MAG: TonB-dependent receptor [Elusimicrobia bacterium]|nr:TonB-dependent receptor [Elusimicrobiota bacterium]